MTRLLLAPEFPAAGQPKELTEKGLRSLMLERGRNIEHIKDYTNTNMDPWEFPHRGRPTTHKKTAILFCVVIML